MPSKVIRQSGLPAEISQFMTVLRESRMLLFLLPSANGQENFRNSHAEGLLRGLDAGAVFQGAQLNTEKVK